MSVPEAESAQGNGGSDTKANVPIPRSEGLDEGRDEDAGRDVSRADGEPGVVGVDRATHRRDPWAHRRAEPRALAFMWTLYLFLASMMTFAYVGTHGTLSWDVYRPVARLMLVTATVGVGVLWPMVRLSQAPPRSRAAMLGDWVVIVLPLTAVILPQAWLAGWPRDVVTALASHLAGWALLVAGVLTVALCGRDAAGAMRRVAAMIACIVLLLAWPAASAAMWALGAEPPAEAALGSPITAIYALTFDQPYRGHWHTVGDGQWWMILAVGCVGLVVFLAAVATRSGEVTRRALH